MRTGRPSAVKWTEEQIAAIHELYAILGPKELAKQLGVDYLVLKNKACSLGIKKDKEFEWTGESLALIRDRYVVDGPKVIAEQIGTTPIAVTAKARRMGLGSTRKTPPKGFEWTEEMLTAVKERYVVEGPNKLAEEFGVLPMTVYRKASDLGLSTIAGHAVAGRTRADSNEACDIHYFDEWTPNMAYILGFAFADGCVQSTLGALVFCLAEKDRCVLEFIKKELKATQPISLHKAVLKPSGRYAQRQVVLSLGSTVMVEQLVRLGLKPRKTYGDFTFPSIPDDMMPHFVRGNLDGDGCTSRGHVCLTGPNNFVIGLRDAMVCLAGMSHQGVSVKKGKTADLATVRWQNYRDAELFYKYAYPEGYEFCLERKKKNLVELLKCSRPRGFFFGNRFTGPTRDAETSTYSMEYKDAWREWSSEDEELLTKYLPRLSLKDIAAELQRSQESVKWKIKQMGL